MWVVWAIMSDSGRVRDRGLPEPLRRNVDTLRFEGASERDLRRLRCSLLDLKPDRARR
jgi:hypothetical protein